MPEGRMLKKKISRDEKVSSLSKNSIILYTWCIPFLDVEGKIFADSHILKGTVVPFIPSFTLKVIENCVDEIGKSGLVMVYGNEHKYMKFKGFEKNQKINKDREAPSEIPDPTPDQLQSNSRVTPAKVNLIISKDKVSGVARATPDSDDEFLKTLKTNPVYKHVNFEVELGKMDVWLKEHSGRKKTRRFIVNWINKIEIPVNFSPKPMLKSDPNCNICHGKGKILDGVQKGATCLCVH